MSQHSNSSESQLQLFPQDSPTVGRNQAYYSPKNSSPTSESRKRLVTSISNLTSAVLVHEFLLTSPTSRSQRKAAPSPLQTSTSATSPPSSVTPTRTTFFSSGVDHPSTSPGSPHSPFEQPRSPKERLDDLLAAERSFYKSGDSSTESSQSATPRYLHSIRFACSLLITRIDTDVLFTRRMGPHAAYPILF
jgi:RalA-binding protein 1